MAVERTISIYGDSILRVTVADDKMNYHFQFDPFAEHFLEKWNMHLHNRAHFGATVAKGLKTLQADLRRGLDCDTALLEFGGNDSNFDWAQVAAEPEGEHFPATSVAQYAESMTQMVSLLREAGVRPVMMTLPPLDAQRYLDFIVRDGLDRAAILHWLTDVQAIYHHQELYSLAAAKLAGELDVELVDVRTAFLEQRDCRRLISQDGIHPSMDGYRLIASVFDRTLAAKAVAR